MRLASEVTAGGGVDKRVSSGSGIQSRHHRDRMSCGTLMSHESQARTHPGGAGAVAYRTDHCQVSTRRGRGRPERIRTRAV